MLATMRPNAVHLVTSRPSSPSPSNSPSRNLSKQQSSNNHRSNMKTSSNNNSKSTTSQQRKQRQQNSEMESTASATPASSSSSTTTKKQSTPGLITLSKPISQQKDQVDYNAPDSPSVDKVSSTSSNKKKSKKGGKGGGNSTTVNKDHRSSSPSPTSNNKDSSQPLPVANKNSTKFSSKKSKSNKPQSRKDVQVNGGGSDPSQLSKSAPTSTIHSNTKSSKSQINSSHLLDSSSGWEMPATPPRKAGAIASSVVSSEKRDSGLTWQQQLLGGAGNKTNVGHSASNSVDFERNHSKGMSKSGSSGNLNSKKKSRDQEASNDSSLTWQQALFASSKPRSTTGLAYDTFADARDAATFGGDGDLQQQQPYGGNGRARSGSLGTRNPNDSSNSSIYIDDVFNNHSSPNVSRVSSNTSMHPSTPIKGGGNKSTPNKKSGLNAYAGPNFHNSPSPASLPAPKFSRNSRNFGIGQHPLADENTSSSNNSIGSASSEDSGSDSGKEDLDRSKRSVTAPADMERSGINANRQTTIETLLARMMGTAT